MDAVENDPILLLRDIEERSKRYAHGLPQQLEVQATWNGLGLRLGELQLVAPMEEISEVLTHVNLSRVPGAKPWVLGVANVRGTLLPVMDLKQYLGGEPTMMGVRSRVLVVNHQGILSGLLVDGVMGMRHFLEEEYQERFISDDAGLAAHARGSYRQGGERWGVVSLYSVLESPEFLQVAA